MENLLSQYSDYFTILKEWVLALSVIPATIAVDATLQSIIRNPRKWSLKWQELWKDRSLLQELYPPISHLVYILGLNFFIELAPLEGRLYSRLASFSFVLCVLLGLRLMQRTAVIGVQWASQKAKHYETFDAGFVPLLQNVTTIFLVLTGGIIILKHFNYDVMSLITALGVGSLAVGLAAKDTLSNMISGFILLIDRNLKPGDRINLGGTVGDVKEIGLRSTQIRVSDGNTLIVANSELVNNRILNLSLPTREVSSLVEIRVPFTVPFDKIKPICIQVAKQVEKISKTRPATVNLVSLSEGHQLIGITIWSLDFAQTGSMVSDFNEALLACFRQEKIPLITSQFCIKTELA